MKIAGNGVGDTRWKVPGILDWATMTHNPFVDITKDTTTLYASDQDVFHAFAKRTQIFFCRCRAYTLRRRAANRTTAAIRKIVRPSV